jgi:hypothetical protein
MVECTECLREGEGIFPGAINKQAGPGWRGSSGSEGMGPKPGVGKLVRVAEGRKLHRRGGRPISHMSCK